MLLEQNAKSNAHDREKLIEGINTIFQDWYVYCSVTKEPIRLSELKYWDVETQEAFKSYIEVDKKRRERLNT